MPILLKRTLTSLQIMQFLVGASYAMLHSFVSYTVPVALTITQAPSRSASAGSSAPTATALMETLRSFVLGAASRVSSTAEGEPTLATTYSARVVPCITTTGQTFAIWLNVLYLAPLTYLFVSFFIASYVRRSSSGTVARKAKTVRERKGGVGVGDRRLSDVVHAAEQAGWDAARGVEREVYGGGEGDEVVIVESDVEREKVPMLKANGNVNGRAKRNGRAPRPRP